MVKFHIEKYHPFLKFEDKEDKRYIYDPVRKSYFVLQPEEIVRQSWILALTKHFHINESIMSVEKQLIVNGQKRRFDLLVFKKSKPMVLFEFKSYNIELDDAVALQIANYNTALEVPYLVISNGLLHYAFSQDYESRISQPLSNLDFLEELRVF